MELKESSKKNLIIYGYPTLEHSKQDYLYVKYFYNPGIPICSMNSMVFGNPKF